MMIQLFDAYVDTVAIVSLTERSAEAKIVRLGNSETKVEETAVWTELCLVSGHTLIVDQPMQDVIEALQNAVN